MAQPSIYRPEIETIGTPALALVDQIRMIDVSYLPNEPVDYLTRDQMVEIVPARRNLDILVEPVRD